MTNISPQLRALFAQCSRVMVSFAKLPVPVLARVHGLATAAGCQLVAQCDLAVASDNARFAVSGINVALFSPSGTNAGIGFARHLVEVEFIRLDRQFLLRQPDPKFQRLGARLTIVVFNLDGVALIAGLLLGGTNSHRQHAMLAGCKGLPFFVSPLRIVPH